MNKFRLYLVIATSIFASLVLSALPLPSFAVTFWPYWTTLVIVYWCLALPEELNIKFAFFAGLSTDFVNSVIIGQYALIYTIIAYMTLLFYSRMRLQPILQQSFSIGILLLPQLIISLWINGMLHDAAFTWIVFVPLLISMLLWPWIFSVLRFFRHKAYQAV